MFPSLLLVMCFITISITISISITIILIIIIIIIIIIIMMLLLCLVLFCGEGGAMPRVLGGEQLDNVETLDTRTHALSVHSLY